MRLYKTPSVIVIVIVIVGRRHRVCYFQKKLMVEASSTMDVRPRSRNLSFRILADESVLVSGGDLSFSRSASIPGEFADNGTSSVRGRKTRRKRKNKASKEEDAEGEALVNPVAGRSLSEIIRPQDASGRVETRGDPVEEGSGSPRIEHVLDGSVVDEIRSLVASGGGSVLTAFEEPSVDGSSVAPAISSAELRQRTVNGNLADKIGDLDQLDSRSDVHAAAEDRVMPSQVGQWRTQGNGPSRLETEKSLDWKSLTADGSQYADSMPVSKFSLQSFWGEIQGGNSLRITASVGNEKKRQRVYNTMFHVPWRCELLIDVGFFVCLDSFLSLLTVMPAQIVMTLWRFLSMRQFQRPCAAELSDFGCFVVLICGVTLLQAIDISLIYHIIRGQGTLKLYVVYNVLEILDKLWQSFGGDVVQVLFNSAEGVASCSPESMTFELMRFILDQTIAVIVFIVHSFILLAQAITLSTCIVAHSNALLALLVSNNFAEVKSNVFKRCSKENLQMLVYYDTIERFHITAYLLFVLAQNILEAEGAWFGSFLANAVMVYMCEVFIDIIKHSFLAKFNDIRPEAYSEFLEGLSKQTLNIEQDEGRKRLTFIPLAPACVVIRVLTPIYAAQLPCSPFWWRLLWIAVLSSLTYVMLVVLKVFVGMGLRYHAAWYVKRCMRKKRHLHFD